MLAGLSASQTVPPGKAEEFMNSNSDEAEASSPLSSGSHAIFREDQREKIVYFSSLLSKGELNCFGVRSSHLLGLAVMHKPGQGPSCQSMGDQKKA